MPDLAILNSLSPLIQLAGGLGFGITAAYLYFKAKADQKKSATVVDPQADLRMRWDGPVGKHLELLEAIADGLVKATALESRVRQCERAIDRMPGSDRRPD